MRSSPTISPTFAMLFALAACEASDGISPSRIRSVSVLPATVSFYSLGDTGQLEATALDKRRRPLAGQTFEWSSSDTNVATVSSSGLVTAVSNGSATITGLSGGKTSNEVIVTVDQVASFLLFKTQPTSVIADEIISPAVEVAVVDSLGNAVEAFAGTVTLELRRNPVEGTLSGTTTQPITAGVATFAALSIDRASVNYDLRATTAGLGSYSARNSISCNVAPPIGTGSGAWVYALEFAGPGTVSVISTDTNTVISKITVGDFAIYMAITPDARFVYVVNWFSGTVSVIATATNTVISTIPVGDGPSAIEVSPDGAFVYVSNRDSESVSVISTATQTVISTIPVGIWPFAITVTPDGAFVYVGNQQSNTVSVISTATNTVIDEIVVGDQPLDLAVTPDGVLVYVANLSSRNVSVISTTANAVVASIEVPDGSGWGTPGSLAITPDGARVYVANHHGNDALPGVVSVISTASNTVLSEVTIGGGPGVLGITPDGAFVYAGTGNPGVSPVYVISTATNTVVATPEPYRTGGGAYNKVVFTPDGELAYVVTGDGPVSVIYTETMGTVATVDVGGLVANLVVKP